MDQQIYDLLVDKIDSVRDDLRDDIKELKINVDELLKFKWKVMGMAILVGIVSAGVFELAVRVVFRV